MRLEKDESCEKLVIAKIGGPLVFFMECVLVLLKLK